MMLDVPPSARDKLPDPKVPLFVTEGARKADAAVSVGLCCVALLGVWNWRGSNDQGGKVALPDWESVALNGRRVFIVFDSDVMEKRAVHAALTRLKAFLESRGAAVRVIYLPPGTAGTKVGLDDFLAAGGRVEDLLTLATDTLRGVRPEPSSNDAVKHPFRLTAAGVEYVEENKDGETEWVRVCSRLEVRALARDAEGRDWGRLLRVTDPDGVEHEWCMPAAMLASDGTDYRRELLLLGLRIGAGGRARTRLHEYISDTLPDERARCVSRVGWHTTEAGNVYVMPDHTFGAAAGERALLQSVSSIEHAMRCAGTLTDWQEQVAARCAGNSRLTFAVSCAFAAPLLHLVNEEGGGFHYRGPSSIGKTTTLRVAGSVWGGGGVGGYLRTWRATANGLEGLAEAHCDALLTLDEMGQVHGREAGEMAYMLANGAGKSRAARDGSARRGARWRILFLSTGELSLADKMTEAGQRARAGQEARLVDIPADAAAGLGLFETLHGFPHAEALARHLSDATARVYGVAVREYLARLTADVSELAEALLEGRRRWMTEYCPSGVDGQVQRVASRFGLVAAAGELASAMAILPWSNGEASSAAALCFRAWLDARGGTGAAEITAGLAQVRHFIEAHGASRFAPWNEPERVTVNRAGFRRATETGGTDYYVLPEVWRGEVCKGHDAGAIARALADRELLVPGDAGHLSRSERPPGHQPMRLYQVSGAILADAAGGKDHA